MTPPPFPRDRHGRWKAQQPEWEAIAAELDRVEVALLVAEAERAVILAEAADGSNVPDARRPLSKPEIASGVRLGRIDQRTTTTADRMLARTGRVAEHVTTAVVAAVATAGSLTEARARVAAWASPITGETVPGLPEQVAAAQAEIVEDLTGAWTASANDITAEAAHQGITVSPPGSLPAAALALITAGALTVATHRAARLLQVAQQTLTAPDRPASSPAGPVTIPAVPVTIPGLPATPTPPPVPAAAAVQHALTTTSPAGTLDHARQAVHQATADARTRTVRDMINDGHQPASYHATEQLDSNTCLRCSHVDGTEYATLDGVLADYYEDGGCRWCAGGARCRGLYVVVWAVETPPTLATPYGR